MASFGPTTFSSVIFSMAVLRRKMRATLSLWKNCEMMESWFKNEYEPDARYLFPHFSFVNASGKLQYTHSELPTIPLYSFVSSKSYGFALDTSPFKFKASLAVSSSRKYSLPLVGCIILSMTTSFAFWLLNDCSNSWTDNWKYRIRNNRSVSPWVTIKIFKSSISILWLSSWCKSLETVARKLLTRL